MPVLIRVAFFCIFLLWSHGAAWAETLRIVTDPTGRTIRVPVHSQRVVALAPSLTEIVFAVGGGAQLVGRTRFADYPPRAEALAVVGTYVNLDIERIAALRPDLCLAASDGTPLTAVRDLERLGIPVFAVSTDTVDAIFDAVLAVGEVLGHGQTASAVVEGMGQDLERILQLVERATTTPRVFYQIAANPIVSVGRGTHVDQLIRMAGGVNLAAGRPGYPRFAPEQVLAMDPDVVILSSMDRNGQIKNVLHIWRQWPQIKAVANERVVQMDSDLLDRPSPRLIQGLEQLVLVLHPELIALPETP